MTQKSPPFVVGGTILLGGAWALQSSMYTVEAGHLAIKYNRLTGLQSDVYTEGVNFRLPWFERPIIFDVRVNPHTINSLTGSRDLQMVNISIRVLSKPDATMLPSMYRTLGLDYDEKVLPSIVNEVLKSVVAQYNASQLLMQRELVSRMVRQRLVQRAKDFHILLEDVALTHLNFSPEYEKAIENKQVAQQSAEKARYLVLQAQEEKKKTIIHAEGEQMSAELIGKAVRKNPAFIELRRIEVAKEIAALLSRSNNRMILSTEGLLLNIMGGADMSSTFIKGSKESKESKE